MQMLRFAQHDRRFLHTFFLSGCMRLVLDVRLEESPSGHRRIQPALEVAAGLPRHFRPRGTALRRRVAR